MVNPESSLKIEVTALAVAKDIAEYFEFAGQGAISVDQILKDIDQGTVDRIAGFSVVLRAGDGVLSLEMIDEIEDQYGIAMMDAVSLLEKAAAERRRGQLKDELESDLSESILRMTR